MTGTSGASVGGNGFEVDPALVASQAQALHIAGDDLASATKPLQGLHGGTADVFGDDAAAAAYANFFTHWKAELSTQVSAVYELAGKVRTSGDNYSATDLANAGSLMGLGGLLMGNGSAGEGQGGMMPNPFGNIPGDPTPGAGHPPG